MTPMFEPDQDVAKDSSTANKPLDAEAQRRLAGLQTPPPLAADYATEAEPVSSEPAPTEDTEANTELEAEPTAKKPFNKVFFVTAAVGSVIGVALFLAFGLTKTATKTKPPVEKAKTEESQIVQDESAPLRSQLAFQDQKRMAGTEQPVPTATPTASPTPQTRDQRRAQAKAERDQRRADRQADRIERAERPERVRTVVRSVPAPRSEEPTPRRDRVEPRTLQEETVDPYQRWASLATLGDVGGTKGETNSATKPASDGPASSSSSVSPGLVPGTSRNAMATGNPFPTVVIGAKPPESLPISAPADSVAPLIAPPPEPVLDEEPNQSFATPGVEVASSSPGAQGILQRRSPDSITDWIVPTEDEEAEFAAPDNPEEGAPITVELGTMAAAQVIVPLAWDLNQNRRRENSTTTGRFAVRLQQDLKSRQGKVALKAGTMLIVQASDVSENNQWVQASAIAIVYRDAEGNQAQQVLPPGALLIQGERGAPLIAQKLNDVGPELFREDLLVGGLRAAGRAGEILNQPREESFVTSNSSSEEFFTGGTSIRRSRDPELLYGFLDGFGNAISQRVERRSQQNTQALMRKNTIAVIPQGTEVSVVINSFFQVNP